MTSIAAAIVTKTEQEKILLHAASEGHSAWIEDLMSTGVDINAQDAEGMTALHHAAAVGSRDCIRVLVASGKCNYLIRDKRGRYASELALLWARDFAAARLLRKKQRHQAFAEGVPLSTVPVKKDQS